MSLAQISHLWNFTEDTPEFTGISQKGAIINKLQYEMEKRDFYFMDHNTKKIIDEMASQTKTYHGRNSG